MSNKASTLNYNNNTYNVTAQKYSYETVTSTEPSKSTTINLTSFSTFNLLTLISLLLLLINISCVDCLLHRDRNKNGHLDVKVGSYAIFNCYIDFPYDAPIPFVIHWSKDHKKIFTWYEGESWTNELYNGRLKLVNNHPDYGKASVNLTAIRESDQGEYHCQIIFPNRSPSVRNNGTFYQLTVQGGSLIKIPPVNQTLMEGQTAFFHCVMKYPESSVMTWHKDGAVLQDIPDLVRRSFIGPDGSLSIDPTMMSDLGEYECHVRNNEGEVQKAKAFLNIQYKAKVIYAPPEVYFPYGQSAILDCHFRANPPLKQLRWYKDGLLYDAHNVPGVFRKANGSLYFAKVDEDHAGSYTCTPYNELGTDGPSPVISVIVLRPPIFTVTPKTVYIQKLGETVELPCDAIDRDGNNRPTILWSRKHGLPLPLNRHRMFGGNLTIEQLTESDRGTYECSATNEAATVSVETEILIENIAPRPPYNLTANSSETAITLRWYPGYMRPNLEYTVWYRLMEAQEWRTLRVLQRNVMEATIQHLLPGREYEFMVLSQDKYGDGMFSKLFRYSTQSAPTTPTIIDENFAGVFIPRPTNDNLTEMGSVLPSISGLSEPWNLSVINNRQGWLLHWEHPQRGLDQLRLYIVRWWKLPEQYLIGTVETFDNFYQLRHLQEDSTYKIQVIALSAHNEEVPSEQISIDVPSQRRRQAIIIASSVAIAFLLAVLAVFLYVKRDCLSHLISRSQDEEAGAADGSASGELEGDCEEVSKDFDKIHIT